MTSGVSQSGTTGVIRTQSTQQPQGLTSAQSAVLVGSSSVDATNTASDANVSAIAEQNILLAYLQTISAQLSAINLTLAKLAGDYEDPDRFLN